jgi:hypothetical protein
MAKGCSGRICQAAIGLRWAAQKQLGEFAMAEQIRQILAEEQDHQIDCPAPALASRQK